MGYKRNEEKLSKHITEIINVIYQGNYDLPRTWTEGVLCTLHKENEKYLCDNYRPITLVNIIYKILSIAITRRIAPIMNILTKETQTAHKQSRSTYDILSILKNIMGQKNADMSITLMDLTKAFDKTNRKLLYTILIKKGLPIELIRLIIKTHSNTYIRARGKNKLSQKQEVNTGVYQGSPLSALLFIIYTDKMMEDYENSWNKKKKRQREGMGEKFKEPIIIENTKKRGWQETFDYVYKTQTTEDEQPENMPI